MHDSRDPHGMDPALVATLLSGFMAETMFECPATLGQSENFAVAAAVIENCAPMGWRIYKDALKMPFFGG